MYGKMGTPSHCVDLKCTCNYVKKNFEKLEKIVIDSLSFLEDEHMGVTDDFIESYKETDPQSYNMLMILNKKRLNK
jgi:hypothetical protein